VERVPFQGVASKWKTPLIAAFMCAHCGLSALAVAAAAGLATLPTFFGMNLAYLLPPLLIGGLFVYWVLWTGRETEACPMPEHAGKAR